MIPMSKKILVVEDDPSALRLAEYALSQEGYQVITASDGLEGLKKARNEHPDLVILDVMLPGLDGYEVCQQLRHEPETAKLTILMLSAKAREIDQDTGLKMGADAYLAKPSDPSAIVDKVKALLASKPDAGARETGQILMVTPRAGNKMKQAIRAKTTDSEMGFRLIPSPSRPNQLKVVLGKKRRETR
jgi:DNA-binding response OmpR family regulator